jgi:hypothetical protein
MEKCTQNVLASIANGSTTIEEWQQYCQRFEQKSVDDIDEYGFETYTGAREALAIRAQHVDEFGEECSIVLVRQGGEEDDELVYPILPPEETEALFNDEE